MSVIAVYYRLTPGVNETDPATAALVCPPDEGDEDRSVRSCTLPLAVIEDDWGEVQYELKLPETIHGHPLTALGDYALDDSDIRISENADSDENRHYVASIVLPASLSSIHPDAFEWLNSLREILVSPENPIYESMGGVLYDKQNHQLIRCPVLWQNDRLIVREGTVSAAENALAKCENLICVLLPDGLETLGDYTFANCGALEYVYLPDSLLSIGEGCFLRCTDLPYLRVPQNVESIGKSAFCECLNLRGVSLPDTYSLTRIGSYAFQQCISLRAVFLPLGLKVIESGCFDGCEQLVEVSWGYHPEAKTPMIQSIDYEAFRGCVSLREIALPEGLRSIGQYAFSGCASLTKVQLPASLKTIIPGSSGKAANGMPFIGCSALEEITVADGNSHFAVHDGALVGLDDSRIICFPSARRQACFIVPDGIREIDMNAFDGHTALEEVVLPDGLESISSRAFAHCSSLRRINLPDSIRSLGAEAFSGCTALESISLPEGLTYIANRAFSGCTALRAVTLPMAVKRLGLSCFEDCAALEEIMLPEGLVELENKVFRNCTGLRKAVLPRSLARIAAFVNTFENCPNLTLHIPRDSYAEEYFSHFYRNMEKVLY